MNQIDRFARKPWVNWDQSYLEQDGPKKSELISWMTVYVQWLVTLLHEFLSLIKKSLVI